MPVTSYKVWAVGSPVGLGATQSVHVGVAGIAKSNAHGPPTTVANELICNRLANSLLLPVPPGFIIDHNGSPHFVSLNFNLAGQDLPPADAATIVDQMPDIATGVLLFDIWVLNGDRHNRNIAHDRTAGRIQVFDHSHALLANGQAHLVSNLNQCAIGGHCIAPELTTLGHLRSWHDKIMSIPEYFIRTVVTDVGGTQFGVTAADAQFCADVLIQRRSQLTNIMQGHREMFPKVDPADWAAFAPVGGNQ